MKHSQKLWTKELGWKEFSTSLGASAQLVFAFGSRAVLQKNELYADIVNEYPNANIVWCSTAGEILDTQVHDDSLCVSALMFEKSTIVCQTTTIQSSAESHEAGVRLAESIPHAYLQHVFIFSDGLRVNGTNLVAGITSALPATVSITGGLVGDGSDFTQTITSLNAPPSEGNIIIIGLYGSSLKIGYGSFGGWDTFGPKRIITKATDNILYEIDNKPALELYKSYLGEQSKNLPSSALLFPLNIQLPNSNEEVVRTILNVNETDQSMTFAGDIPVGSTSQLMRANFERLIDGASGAAVKSIEPLGGAVADFALLISCVGRKLVLKERTEEEVEAVRDIVGTHACMTGFYSYGELCPIMRGDAQCQLHNQTMTITTIREV